MITIITNPYIKYYCIFLLFRSLLHDYDEELFQHWPTALQTQPVIFYETS